MIIIVGILISIILILIIVIVMTTIVGGPPQRLMVPGSCPAKSARTASGAGTGRIVTGFQTGSGQTVFVAEVPQYTIIMT